jgi:hypothetical protein
MQTADQLALPVKDEGFGLRDPATERMCTDWPRKPSNSARAYRRTGPDVAAAIVASCR